MHKPDGQDHKITGLKGQSGEVLQLINSISTKLSVEIWLSRLESEMQSSLKGLLWSVLQEMKSKDFNPSQFYETYSKKMPGQICILAARVLHTAELETYCKIGQHQTIKRLGIRSKDTIAKLMELASKFDSGVSSVYRSFIALEIYYRDWQHEMHVNKVKNLNSYSWVKGLRYYHHEEEMTVPVRQLINSMNYGFEFLSLKPQVWNELTERTFLTIWV